MRPTVHLGDYALTADAYSECEGRDGIAYSFNLMANGRYVARVRNAGDGGMTTIDWKDRTLEPLFEQLAKALPPVAMGSGRPVPSDLSLVLAQLADEVAASAINTSGPGPEPGSAMDLQAIGRAFRTPPKPGDRFFAIAGDGTLLGAGATAEEIAPFYADGAVVFRGTDAAAMNLAARLNMTAPRKPAKPRRR